MKLVKKIVKTVVCDKHSGVIIIENQKDVNPERIKAYVENVLLNEKVFQFLENQK